MVEKMNYLITTFEDSYFVSQSLREDNLFDVVVLWENVNEAVEVDRIQSHDSVVVAIKDRPARELVLDCLRQKGIPNHMLLDFFGIYNANIPFMVADRVMSNPFYELYEGIILGLSHAEVGIISDNLKIPFANLAVSSQDLFYDLETFQYVLDKYASKLRNLRYLVVDMYKYNYFNFDVSRSKMAYLYYSIGGFHKHPHHFDKNPFIHMPFENLIYQILNDKFGAFTDQNIKLWNNLFEVKKELMNARFYSNYPELHTRNKIVSEREIEEYNYHPSNVMKHFSDTMAENEQIFRMILKKAKEWNPNMRIIILQMPMLREGWERSKQYYEPWKAEFESIMNRLKKEVDFEYFDLTKHALSEERSNWYDVEHLNYLGALRFTDYLNGLL